SMRSGGTGRPRTTFMTKGRTSFMDPGPPNPSISTASYAIFASATAEFVDSFHKQLHVIVRSRRQNSMSQIEDMPGPTSGLLQNSRHSPPDFLWIGQQNHGIEVALDGHVVTDLVPPAVKADPPIQSDDVPSSLTHEL